MDIGGVHIPTPLALAPMAGVTDLAFRPGLAADGAEGQGGLYLH